MARRGRETLEITPQLRIRFQIAIWAIAWLLLAVCACSRDSRTRSKIELVDLPSGKRAAGAEGVPELPHCPPAGVATIQPSASTGHHRVILSWNASAPGGRPEDSAIGYCLYRSQTKDMAKKNATCSGCEQINSTPVVATGCEDDLVEDGAAYYYVATAINAAGRLSVSSNEIAVSIPSSKQSVGSAPAGSYALCRAPVNSKSQVKAQ